MIIIRKKAPLWTLIVMTAFDRDLAGANRADAPRIAAAVPDTRMAGDDELDTRTLFADSRRRVIVHQGERYCLQLTRAGKLLLTK